MHVHINHMYCRDSNWGGGYNSRYMVSIKRFIKWDGPETPDDEDWSLLNESDILDKHLFSHSMKRKDNKLSGKKLREMCQTKTQRLKPEVYRWLEENIVDSKDADYNKAFCVGTDQYNAVDYLSFNIFFYRRSDAMKFIRTWSVYKKPTTYFDYFKEIRKEYNFKTKTLQVVEEFTLD